VAAKAIMTKALQMARATPLVGRNRFIAPLRQATGVAPFGEADGAIKRLCPTTARKAAKAIIATHRKWRGPHLW